MGGQDSFELLDMICLFASAAVIVMGYLEVRDKTLVGRKNNDEYTVDSQQKLAAVEGPLYMAIGVMGILTALAGGIGVLPDFLYWPCLIIAISLIVADAVLIKKILVKKNKFTDIDLHKKLK
ncbi:MAG: hypothetical protein Q4E54_05905 [Lachnospiraceae bacterium]|nr:hypothetical protein [Lachnospiraceae bacterium]